MRTLMILGCLLIIAGCDSNVAPKNVPKVDSLSPAQSHLLDTQRHVLEQAGQLDGNMQRDAAAQRRTIEQQAQ